MAALLGHRCRSDNLILMPRIYTSPYPDLPIPRRSIYTHIFSRNHDPQLPAYIDAPSGKTLSRADVRSQSLQVAWSLRNALGQKTGATMAIFSPNSLWWPVILLGGIAAGLRVTTINSAYTPPELVHHLKDSGAYLIFTHPALLRNLREALRLMGVSDAEARKRTILAGSVVPEPYKSVEDWQHVEQLLHKGELDHEVSFDGDAADDTALLCYSSGTTSLPKGVELTHRNVVTIPIIVERNVHYLKRPGAFMLSVLPFYHIYGLVKLLLLPFFVGAPQAIMSQFTPEEFCANIERYKVTIALIVPPILVVLSSHPVLQKYDMRSLQILFSGAAPLGEELVHKISSRFRNVGVDIVLTQGYGLSETSPTTHILDDEKWLSKVGSIGTLLPNLQARLVLDDGETDANEGEPGELWLKGPNIMKGYLNNPEATRNSITPDKWFKTGDVATVDKDGYFKIVDRKKELIKYKGFQVPPAELESVLLTHPKVLDAGVIGIWVDAEATEYPRAFVVPPGGTKSFKTRSELEAYGREIQTWIQDKVARHKYLRGGVVAIDAIPKSAAGKILRRQLRELSKEEHAVTGTMKARL